MENTSEPSWRVITVERTFEILGRICGADGVSASEIRTGLGPARSTVHDHLVTLRERGVVVYEEDVPRQGQVPGPRAVFQESIRAS